MGNKHGRDLLCPVVISAVKRSKTGKEGDSPERVARKASLRRFHVGRVGEHLCRRNGQYKGLENGTCVLSWGNSRVRWTDRRNGTCDILSFSLYLHCLLRDALHHGRQNQYYQCQLLGISNPGFLSLHLIG